MNAEEVIKSILPEATIFDRGKWKYKEWVICPGCGFVRNEQSGERRRFMFFNAYRTNEDFKKVLEGIK